MFYFYTVITLLAFPTDVFPFQSKISRVACHFLITLEYEKNRINYETLSNRKADQSQCNKLEHIGVKKKG